MAIVNLGILLKYGMYGAANKLANGRNIAALDDVWKLDNNGISKAANLNSTDIVTYYRVQGGTPPKASWKRITKNDNGSITIQKGVNVNISTGNIDHAIYYLKKKRAGGEIVAFDVPKWLDNFVKETAIKQRDFKENPLNQGGSAPKKVDPTTPGDSYEFPPIWSEWFEEYATNGRIIKDIDD
ncbi:hypothetical protein [Paenibacillus sp. Leaf72]|uniref:hypothetical protein n=1 Tax=Paenibacillus sp. Leaf72 TaxID=1736234 RepID=UPI0006F4B7FF|nr:hypothetical protein [Paenibacillus sp. Leaf72]KQO02798.1 hypothetical protein ASF12_33125 [Paenibacillus sp. Leaf72]